MTKNNKILTVLIIILTIFWSFNIIISAFAGATEDIIFKHRTGDVSHNHTTQVTPNGYTFMIWNLIFIWLLAGYIFLIVCIFKTSQDGSGKIFCSPEVFTTSVAVILIINCGFYTSWLFIWDNAYMTAASVILFCIMGTNWLALGLFSYSLYENTRNLQERSPMILNCYRILLQNALGLYATWTTIAALLNFTIALVYEAELEDPLPSIISLGLLTAILAIWIPLDTFVLDKYCRYMLTPLFVVLWALIGILSRLQKVEYENDTPKNFTFALTGIVSVLLIGRLVLTAIRAFKFPLN